jgi:hypothetical protein
MKSTQITTTRAAVILALVLAAIFFALWRRANTRERRYEAISRGMTDTEVIQLLGTPDAVQKCGPFMPWDSEPQPSDRNTGQCVAQYVYKSPLLIMPEKWSVGFDANRRAVSKYHYISP